MPREFRYEDVLCGSHSTLVSPRGMDAMLDLFSYMVGGSVQLMSLSYLMPSVAASIRRQHPILATPEVDAALWGAIAAWKSERPVDSHAKYLVAYLDRDMWPVLKRDRFEIEPLTEDEVQVLSKGLSEHYTRLPDAIIVLTDRAE